MSLPTLYQHYTNGGITTGLSADNQHFTLNDRNITLYSGAMHYFRVPPEYWRDRLRKMRAAGLNAVETYVPWNLHEPEPGRYDFGAGGTDFQDLLDIEKFLRIAQEEDLFAIVRPGPYICSEWEFGGMPSWLLRDREVRVRSSEPKFMSHVTRYITTLFVILVNLQFTKGGPIIAMQLENEYGGFQLPLEEPDTPYLEQLRDLFKDRGIEELLFTSDTPLLGSKGMLPGTLYTANFQYFPKQQLERLDSYQPDKAAMVMEYWTGWFDHWTEAHHTITTESFSTTLEVILSHPASVNFYMFIGGTNWGFLNGANSVSPVTDNSGLQPDTSSYDYDAPLTENGDYGDKYFALKEIIAKYNDVPTALPPMPERTLPVVYPNIDIVGQLSLSQLTDQVPVHVSSTYLVPMEDLPINNEGGQSYGYIIYRMMNIDIPAQSQLQIMGRPSDIVMVLINGKLVSKPIRQQSDMFKFGTWNVKDGILDLGDESYSSATLDLVVENFGRLNFGTLGMMEQRKGLWRGDALLNGEALRNWRIIPLEFRKSFNTNLRGWETPDFQRTGPQLYRAVMTIDDDPQDTYIDMTEWRKGIVIVNGFVISRHFRLGPQQRVYVPGPFLKQGENEILVFEHFETNATMLTFADKMLYETLPLTEIVFFFGGNS